MGADPILRGHAATPVARRHAAPALPGVLRAPGHDHRRRRQARQRAAGLGQPAAVVRRALQAARGRVLLRTGVGRPTAPSSTRPTTPTGRRCPTRSPTSGSARPALYEALGWTVTSHPDLEADDLMYAYAKARGRGRRAGADPHRRPRHVPVRRRRDHDPAPARAPGGARTRWGAAEVEERYGIPPAVVPDFIALRGDPSDGLPGREGDRREDGRRPAAPPRQRSRPRSPARCARSRPSGAR